MRAQQTSFIKKTKSDYGGRLRNTRRGRATARPLATRSTMHLILKSSRAKGDFSFARPKHAKNIARIIEKFAFVYGVRIVSFANAWNHLHLQIQLSNRHTYNSFIRAVTGAIAMSVTGRTRWSKANSPTSDFVGKFWDHRPFTRIASSFAAYVNLKDSVRQNAIEATGHSRREARDMVQVEKLFFGIG